MPRTPESRRRRLEVPGIRGAGCADPRCGQLEGTTVTAFLLDTATERRQPGSPITVNRDQLHIDRLTAEHDVSTFDCGIAELDDWIRRHAVAAQAMDSARTFVAVHQSTVVGYFRHPHRLFRHMKDIRASLDEAGSVPSKRDRDDTG